MKNKNNNTNITDENKENDNNTNIVIYATISDKKNEISCMYEYIEDTEADVYYQHPITGGFSEFGTARGLIFQDAQQNTEYNELYNQIGSGAYSDYFASVDVSDIGRTITIEGTSTIIVINDVEAI